MERLNRILRHPLWKGALQQIEELESERIFCRHDLDHFLHVARIAYIENLKKSSMQRLCSTTSGGDCNMRREYLTKKPALH